MPIHVNVAAQHAARGRAKERERELERNEDHERERHAGGLSRQGSSGGRLSSQHGSHEHSDRTGNASRFNMLRGATGLTSLGTATSSWGMGNRPPVPDRGKSFASSTSRRNLGEPADLPPEHHGIHMQRSVFKWISMVDELSMTSHKRAKVTISAYDMAVSYGLPQDQFVRHLNQQIEEADSCTSLPFTLLMVAAYTVMVILHDPAPAVYAVEEAVGFDIEDNANFAWTSEWVGHKMFIDIDTHADVWSFLTEGLVPLIMIQELQLSEMRNPDDEDVAPYFYTIPQEDRGVVLNYNRMVGGVRIRQERGEVGPCDTYASNLGFYKIDCRHGLGYELWPETWTAFTTTDPIGEFWLWVHDPQTTMLDILYQKEASDWFDAATRKIEIAVPIVNLNYNIYTIVFVNLYFSRGGHIWKRIIPMSTYSSWWHGPHNIVVDTIWVSCMCWISLSEGWKIRSIYNVSGWRGIRNDYLNFWIIIDWISVAIAVVLVLIFSFRLNATSHLNSLLTAIAGTDYLLYEDEYRARCQEFLEALDVECHQTYQFRIALGVYPLVIIMRLFKAFSAQPRLSMVTRTISGAAVDLLHFLLVFASIFLTYAVAGIILFGREADGFATLPRAVVSCFRFMMGEFDWEDIAVVGRGEAGLWFISFMVIMTMLMLNMLLAMVMDSYSKQKEKIGMADTLLEEAMQTYRRWIGRRRREQLPMRDVLKSVHDHYAKFDNNDDKPLRITSFFSTRTTMRRSSWDKSGELDIPHDFSRQSAAQLVPGQTRDSLLSVDDPRAVLLTVDRLMSLCRGLRKRQACELIMAAILHYYEDNKEEVKLEDMLKMLFKVEYTTKKMKEKVQSDIEQASREIGLDGGGRTQGGQQQLAVVKEVDEDAIVGKMASNDSGQGSDDDEADGEMSKALSEMEDENMQQREAEPTFMEVLDTCRLELREATEWIGQDWQTVTEGAFKIVTNADARRAPPLQRLDDVPEYGLVRVLEDEEDVLDACRMSGISEQNDELRRRVLGRVGRCIQKDHEDNTMKCEIPGFTAVWLGVRAVSRAPFPPAVQRAHELAEVRQKNDENRSTRSTFTLKSSATSLRSATTLNGPGETPAAKEDALASLDPAQMVRELESELHVGQQTLKEATKALDDLTTREVLERKEKEQVARRFRQLKKQVVVLTQEHMKLQEEVRSREASLGDAHASKDEYMALVHTMIDENQRLKARLATGRRSRPASAGNSRTGTSVFSEEPEPMPEDSPPQLGPGIHRSLSEDDRDPGPMMTGYDYVHGPVSPRDVVVHHGSPRQRLLEQQMNHRRQSSVSSMEESDSDIDLAEIQGSLAHMRERMNLIRSQYVRPASDRNFHNEPDPRQRRHSSANRRFERDYARRERSRRGSDASRSSMGWGGF